MLMVGGCGGGGSNGGTPPPPDAGVQGRQLWLPASVQATLHGNDGVQLRGSIDAPGSITITGAGVSPFGRPSIRTATYRCRTLVAVRCSDTPKNQIAMSGSPAPGLTIMDDGLGALNGPVGLAFDTNGNLWVGNYWEIRCSIQRTTARRRHRRWPIIESCAARYY
jgi:hypothetical protein